LIYNVRWIFTEKQIPRQNEKLIRKCKMQALLTESLPGAPKSQHLRLHIIKNKVNTKDRGAPKSTGVTSGDKAGTKQDICPRAQHFGGAKLRSECYERITKC